MERWINGRRIDNLSAKVTKLHRLHVRELIDSVGVGDYLRVSGHKAIHVCPNLQRISSQYSCKHSCCIIGTSSSQIRHMSRCHIRSYESRHYGNSILLPFKSFFYQLLRFCLSQHVLAAFMFRLHEKTRVIEHSIPNERTDNERRQSFAIAHNCILHIGRHLLQQIKSLADILQLIQQRMHLAVKGAFPACSRR